MAPDDNLRFSEMLARLLEWAQAANYLLLPTHIGETEIEINLSVAEGEAAAAYELLGANWEALGGVWGGRAGNPHHFALGPPQ